MSDSIAFYSLILDMQATKQPSVPYAFRIVWFWVVASLIFAANLQLLATFPMAFIAPNWYNKFARNIAQLLWPGLVWSFEILNRNKVVFYGDIPPENEAAIVLANHQYHCDWLIVFDLALRRRVIRGVRVVVKVRPEPFKFDHHFLTPSPLFSFLRALLNMPLWSAPFYRLWGLYSFLDPGKVTKECWPRPSTAFEAPTKPFGSFHTLKALVLRLRSSPQPMKFPK